MIGSCADVASLFDKESNPLHRILPFNRKSTHVTDDLFFASIDVSIRTSLSLLNRSLY